MSGLHLPPAPDGAIWTTSPVFVHGVMKAAAIPLMMAASLAADGTLAFQGSETVWSLAVSSTGDVVMTSILVASLFIDGSTVTQGLAEDPQIINVGNDSKLWVSFREARMIQLQLSVFDQTQLQQELEGQENEMQLHAQVREQDLTKPQGAQNVWTSEQVGANGERITIALVDDDNDYSISLADALLPDIAATITRYYSCEDLIDHFLIYDLYIVDGELPGRSGPTCVNLIRTIYREAKIIGISASERMVMQFKGKGIPATWIGNGSQVILRLIRAFGFQ